jgi:RNA polymerase sigma factor (sigma-70 family)
MSDDLELWEAWIAGDSASGNALVQRHFASIHRFFSSKVPQHVDELTQRTFLACVEARDRGRAVVSFRAYLYGIARLQLLRHLEGRGGARPSLDLSRVSIHDLRSSPSRAIGRAEDHDLLLSAIQRIPIDFQIVLELHYWEELSVGEIASAIEVAEGTVKSRLHRARAMIREELDAMATDAAGFNLEVQARALSLALAPKK